jgi:hypothetical protein
MAVLTMAVLSFRSAEAIEISSEYRFIIISTGRHTETGTSSYPNTMPKVD